MPIKGFEGFVFVWEWIKCRVEIKNMKKVKKGGLIRSFGLKMAIILVMSTIIGSGVFKKVAPMAEALGSPTLVIISWVLAGLVILSGVVGVAELAAALPDSGGPYAWLEKIYGKMVSFLYGWSSFTVIQSAALAAVAFVFAGAVNTFVPLPRFSPELENTTFLGIHFLDNIGAKVVTCVLIIGLTIANIRGTKYGGLISKIFTFSIVFSIALIIGAAFGSGAGSVETFKTQGSTFPVEGFTFLTLISAMFIATRHAFWAFEGWIALGFIGEEIKKPGKNIPKAMIYGICSIILIYILINTAYLYVLPIDEMLSQMRLDDNNIAAVLVVDKIIGKGGAYIVSAMILISTFGCTNATTLLSARVYYAMARKNWFFKPAAKTHKKFNTPHYALIYQCVWACLLTVSGSFDLLTDLVIISAFVFYGMTVFGVVLLRRKSPNLKRPYKSFGYPIVPIFFALFCVLMLVVTFVESPGKSLVGLGLIFSGLPFYYYWKNKNNSSNDEELFEHTEETIEIED